ncbi:unnamed protein product [Aureobasidium vineae]|uniref:Uncharacterized protein n=1 Tax=Aureobasidium vineae TaxID=2773715 RepID=A0A9N8JID3_9PEZI|nr:unnamed protein product [Aureobasidium vineae]
MASLINLMEDEAMSLLQTRLQTPRRHIAATTKHRFELAATAQCMLSNRRTGFLDLPAELRFRIYYLALADLSDHDIMFTSKIHVRPPNTSLVPHSFPSDKDRQRTITPAFKNQVYEPAITRTAKTIRTELLPLLYERGTPISYTFYACSTTLIRQTLRRIRTEDIPLELHLATLTFSLPKQLDDTGLAIPWLVSLATCLAWCLYTSPIPEIIITEPEFYIKEPYVAVNETDPPSLSISNGKFSPDFITKGTNAELSTTATDLVTSFLKFTSGLSREEMKTEGQSIFALADFLHARVDKCKECVLWRGSWKECLGRIYGHEVAKVMVRERNLEPL